MEVREKSVSVLKNESYGYPISERLSNLIRTYTNRNDRANVCKMTGVGSSTVRDVTYRNNNLTESNSKAIVELIRIAINNCNNSVTDAREAANELRDVLNGN